MNQDEQEEPQNPYKEIMSRSFTLSFSFAPKDLVKKTYNARTRDLDESNERPDECTIQTMALCRLFKPITMEPNNLSASDKYVQDIIPIAVHVTNTYSSCPIFLSLRCLHRNALKWNTSSHFSNYSREASYDNFNMMTLINAFQTDTSWRTMFDYKKHLETPVFRTYGHITCEDIAYEKDDRDDDYLLVQSGKLLDLQLSGTKDSTANHVGQIPMVRFEKERVLEMVAIICSNTPPIEIMHLDDLKFKISPMYQNISDNRNYAWGNSFEDTKDRNCTVLVNITVDFIYPTHKHSDLMD